MTDISKSSYRENLIEHLFVGELMRHLWINGIAEVEVLKPEVDDSGYDLVIEANSCVRHIQLKSSFASAATSQVKASMKLAAKPSACVVWIEFEPKTMQLGPFLWFGGRPNERITDFSSNRVAKHTRANAQGVKQERPNQRMLRRSSFERLANYEALIEKLFGNFPIRRRAV